MEPDRIVEIFQHHEQELLDAWLAELKSSGIQRDDLMRESELRQQCAEVIRLFRDAAQSGNLQDLNNAEWDRLKEALGSTTRARVRQGFTPTQIATFIMSLKRPLFDRLRESTATTLDMLAQDIWVATNVLDRLALFTTEVYQRTREELISRQQQELLELSTPVVKLWEGVLALPLIGTLDSARTQVVMESLLQRIVETGSEIAIIDITGVPTVDTLVAQHLMKTVAAARLMGADCIVSGIRPQIAQTIVHLGVTLNDVVTKASLASAIQVALQRTGYAVSRVPAPAASH